MDATEGRVVDDWMAEGRPEMFFLVPSNSRLAKEHYGSMASHRSCERWPKRYSSYLLKTHHDAIDLVPYLFLEGLLAVRGSHHIDDHNPVRSATSEQAPEAEARASCLDGGAVAAALALPFEM